MEIFKDIEGFEGLYQVSNCGRVKSVERTIIRGNGRPLHVKEKILRQVLDGRGYLGVWLSKNGAKEPKKVHKLVAKAFLPNPHGYTDVHHKNHKQLENRIENLEWFDGHEHRIKHADEQAKIVYQYTLDGLLVNVWKSAYEAARQLGFSQSNICGCCNGKRKTHMGYIWSYVPL